MKNSTLSKWGCLVPIVAFLLFSFVVYFVKEIRTSDGRKALPSEADNVEEYHLHAVVLGDFTRLLKARLPERRYSGYAESLELFERFDPKLHPGIESQLNMTLADAPAWWNPPAVDSTAYFEHKQGDDYMRVLRYHNGSVYLLVISW